MPIFHSPLTQITWHYELKGEGQSLLFIHGWGVDSRIWRQQVKYFSKKFKVLTLDLPGHGQTSWQKVSLRRMAEDIKMILDEIRFTSINIVGSSLGGMIALTLFEIDAHRIKQLSLVGSMPKFAKSAQNPFGLDIERIRKLNIQLSHEYPTMVHIFFRSLFTKTERASRRFKWVVKFRPADDVPFKEALVEYLDILEKEDLRLVLKKLNVPVQLINGCEDEICPQQAAFQLKAMLPSSISSRLDLFEDCGHFPFLSKPYEFNELLEEFINAS